MGGQYWTPGYLILGINDLQEEVESELVKADNNIYY